MAMIMKKSELRSEIKRELERFNEFHTIEEIMQINDRIEKLAKEMRSRRDRFDTSDTYIINLLERWGF